jgi:uncharacterized protein (TIGR00730 family)
MQHVCVFCGSSPGARPLYVRAARELGGILARRGLALVYGGAKVGTMGQLAQSALDAGGHVIGVIPRALVDLEVAHTGLPDLRIVDSMHERKALMADLSDAFVALPGGLGTIEEFFEVLCWSQLGLHAKPCGLLNVGGYYDRLTAFLDHTVEEQFVRASHRDRIVVERDVDAMLDALARYRAPRTDKAAWILQMNERIR